MITKWYVTGDTHRDFSRFKNYDDLDKQNENLGVIILGDVGLNYMIETWWPDYHIKNSLKKKYKFSIYCVKGNHEARPSECKNMQLVWDDNVNGEVWVEDDFPNIKYFKEVGEYIINGYHVLVIGGAYSVDKWYRLQFDKKWYASEQLTPKRLAEPYGKEFVVQNPPQKPLTQEEMDSVKSLTLGKQYDFVFSHTCPISWEPTDLFLGCIDQTTVDTSMEWWMNQVKDTFDWNIWLFGHFHADRIERPHVQQFYMDYEDLDSIWNRWNGKRTYADEWDLNKSPTSKTPIERSFPGTDLRCVNKV